MKSLPLRLLTNLILNSGKEFSNNHQIDDKGGCKERVLTDSVHGDGVASSHHEFGVVLVHSDFGISYGRDIFDDDAVIDFVANFVVEEDLVGGDDVVYD